MADNVQDPDSVLPQGLPASYHCWVELPGELRRLPAFLEEMTEDTGFIYCQAQQVRGHRTTSPTTDAFCSPQMPPTSLPPMSSQALRGSPSSSHRREVCSMQQEHFAHSFCPGLTVWWEMWALNNGTHSGRSVLEEAGVRAFSSWARPDPHPPPTVLPFHGPAGTPGAHLRHPGQGPATGQCWYSPW